MRITCNAEARDAADHSIHSGLRNVWLVRRSRRGRGRACCRSAGEGTFLDHSGLIAGTDWITLPTSRFLGDELPKSAGDARRTGRPPRPNRLYLGIGKAALISVFELVAISAGVRLGRRRQKTRSDSKPAENHHRSATPGASPSSSRGSRQRPSVPALMCRGRRYVVGTSSAPSPRADRSARGRCRDTERKDVDTAMHLNSSPATWSKVPVPADA